MSSVNEQHLSSLFNPSNISNPSVFRFASSPPVSTGIFSHRNSAGYFTQNNVLEPCASKQIKNDKTKMKGVDTKNNSKKLNIAYSRWEKPFVAPLRVKTPPVLMTVGSAATENTRLGSHSAPLSTTHPLINAQTGILALCRLMYFLISIAFRSSSSLPVT